MPSISNDYLLIEISTKGAELQSIWHKEHALQYMWSGDPAFWAKQSPVLFPIVGELKDKKYSYKEKEYHLSRHGFARESEFTVTEQKDLSITFTLTSNADTLQNYPFAFRFSVMYSLRENALEVSFRVENTGDEEMFFSVGGHPAFKIPLAEGSKFEDYELVFSEKESVSRWPISPDGLIQTEPTPLLNDENVLPLKKELFANDAIVLKGLKSRSLSIVSAKTSRGIQVEFSDFPYLGIWQTKGGDFLCIEPWCGIADSVEASGILEEKEGINVLAPSAKFVAAYSITFF